MQFAGGAYAADESIGPSASKSAGVKTTKEKGTAEAVP